MIFDDIESLLKEYKQVQILEVPFNPVDPILWSFLKKQERLSVVSERIQRKIQRALAPFWQQRFISIENKEAPLVRHFLLSPLFFLQTDLVVEDTPFPKTNPALLSEALQKASLPESVLDRTLLSLSNGELRRILLARVWMENPEWVYFNDLFGGLDAAYRPYLEECVLKMVHSDVKMVIRLAREEEVMPLIPAFVYENGKFVLLEKKREGALKSEQVKKSYSEYEIEKLTSSAVEGKLLFDLKNVNVCFGETEVIQNLSWQVRSGEHWVVMGPNGAGKSTLLALLSADHPQIYKNDIMLLGERPGKGLDVWAHKEKLGFFSPELALQYREELTLQEVLCTGFSTSLGLFKEPVFEEREKANEWLHFLGFEDTKVAFSSLTLIEKRLVLIARAAIKPPSVLILDEPTQGMDAKHRAKIFNWLDYLSSSTTIILVSHYLNEWPKCMTHILHMPKFSMPL
ncbi:MAG TPA: ATP-binding cassette domain-containing protein [Fibrobacteraceae bacterium]|jgi:molybdate transport system ATP-binding protein|nr:ATP-binding cassette domain-containing protein [Fibrobacter sp.]HOG68733.1 ATP-binding cassette domain-containing protein [Fibrobacteraceae bacterium]HPW93864.1 ATP-binding cassette domain-containing protein [Fibrobacteraceae bacterium]